MAKKKAVEEKKVVEVESPFNPLSDAFQAAAEKKDEVKVAAVAEKPLIAEDLKKIPVKVLSPEELAAAAKEIEENKKAAQVLGGSLTQLTKGMEDIFSIPGWEDLSRLKDAVNSYRKQIEDLKSLAVKGGKDFQKQVEVALLFLRTNTAAATEANIRDLMKQTAEQGRGNLCYTESFPFKQGSKRDFGPNAVVFKDIALVPLSEQLDEKGRQNKTNHGLYTALRKLITRYYSDYEKEQEERMKAVLSEKALDNLEPLLNFKINLADKVGVYRIKFPEKRDNGKVSRAGAAIFAVGFKGTGNNPYLTVEVRDGAGSLSDFAEMKGFWFDFGFLFAKELPERMSEKQRENAERFIRVFRAATFELRKAYYDAKNNKPKPEKVAKKKTVAVVDGKKATKKTKLVACSADVGH